MDRYGGLDGGPHHLVLNATAQYLLTGSKSSPIHREIGCTESIADKANEIKVLIFSPTWGSG
jgi:hypothetical protein